MKTAFIYLILFFSANALFAQNSAQTDTLIVTNDAKLDDQRKGFFHDFGAVYIGSNYNDVGNQLALFLQRKMNLNFIDNSFKGDDLITSYETSMGKLKKLNVAFKLDDSYTIKSMLITGNPDLIIELFVKYWATSLNFDDLKDKTFVKCNMWGDLIELKTNKNECYMTITAQK